MDIPPKGNGASENGRKIRWWFGVEHAKPPRRGREAAQTAGLELSAGTITLITGASGAGKSTLLRTLRRRHGETKWINVNRIPLPDALVVDCFEDEDLELVLSMLGRVGLGEVWTYLRKPYQLSDGERWRLRWALALWRARRAAGSARTILAADEFCAVLDGITARVLSRCLRRTIEGTAVAVVLATWREDLEAALCPDAMVRCDFGKWMMTLRSIKGGADGMRAGKVAGRQSVDRARSAKRLSIA